MIDIDVEEMPDHIAKIYANLMEILETRENRHQKKTAALNQMLTEKEQTIAALVELCRGRDVSETAAALNMPLDQVGEIRLKFGEPSPVGL